MSEKEQPSIMDQTLCVNGCGFFGSSNTSHMCSKCWKDTMAKSMLDAEGKKDGGKEKEPAVPTPPPAVKATIAVPEPASSSITATTTSSPRPSDVAVPPQPPSTTAAAAASAAVAAAAVPVSPVSFSAGVGTSASASAGAAPAAVGGVAVGVAGAAGAAPESSSALPVQVNRKRCFACSKKVGYTGIACRCNYVFCSIHRYPDQHDCPFDFKTSDRNDLKRTVVGGGQFSKVDRL